MVMFVFFSEMISWRSMVRILRTFWDLLRTRTENRVTFSQFANCFVSSRTINKIIFPMTCPSDADFLKTTPIFDYCFIKMNRERKSSLLSWKEITSRHSLPFHSDNIDTKWWKYCLHER